MGRETWLTYSGRLGRRAIRLILPVLFLSLLVLKHPTVAQEDDVQRAGLVVQFSDGGVYTACVDLGPDGEATGEEVLRASGLGAVLDYGAGFGNAVCKIGDEGCSFPAEKCFCRCTMKPGDPCVYWAYFHLLDGQWRYSVHGANSHIVRVGDVEGWAWGPGTASGGTPPPLIPFEQLCSDPPTQALPTAIVTSEPTATPEPTTTSPLSATPSPRLVEPTPTATAPASKTFAPQPDQVTTATAMPKRVPSATLIPTAEREVSPVPTATSTAQASPTLETARALSHEKTNAPALSTGEPDETINYIFFGTLAVALAAGLVVSRIRQKE